jgi:hypothetical protein
VPQWVDDVWGVVGSPLTRKKQIEVRSIAHLLSNIYNSALNPGDYLANRRFLGRLEAQLQQLAERYSSKEGIPRVLHFVFGFKKREFFPYYALLSLKSAMYHNPGWDVVFHYHHEPHGEYWDHIKARLVLNQIPNFSRFGIARISHYAHKADIVRLLALNTIGGAYLDIDTLTIRSFEELCKNPFVMGVQANHNGARGGLCNAAMLGQRGSLFGEQWLKRYRYFHSKGRDYLWDFHSVKLPAMLASRYPSGIRILDHDAFFYPMWTDVQRILFAEDSAKWLSDLQTSYLFHLWNNFTEEFLLKVDEPFVRHSKSAYAMFVRPVVDGDFA